MARTGLVALVDRVEKDFEVQLRLSPHHMKLLIEILLSVFLHPIAMILMWINLIRRSDLTTFRKSVWFVVSLIWGLGPILYLLVAEGALW